MGPREGQSVPIYLIHWNGPDVALESANGLKRSESLVAQVVIVDNASQIDNKRRLVDALPSDIRMIELDENIGFAGAANVAFRDAQRLGVEWFGIAAHDVIVAPDCLSLLVDALESDSSYGVVGPVFWNDDWTSPVSTGGIWGRTGGYNRKGFPPGPLADVLSVDWLHGALLLIRRACAEEIGGFRDELFTYCEDVDLCLRARDVGWDVGVVAAARAREPGYGVSDARHVYLIRRNSLLMLRERRPPARFLGVSVGVAAAAARAAVGSVLPWRPPARRRKSWDYARGQLHAVIDALAARTGPGWGS